MKCGQVELKLQANNRGLCLRINNHFWTQGVDSILTSEIILETGNTVYVAHM